MAWSWLRRRADRTTAPTPPAVAPPAPNPVRRAAAWPDLPPLQRTLAPLSPVAPLDAFTGSLTAHQNPSFLAPLGHQIDPNGPGGLVTGLAAVAPGQATPYAGAADLAVPTRVRPRPAIQRQVVGWSTAAEVHEPDPAPAAVAEEQAAVAGHWPAAASAGEPAVAQADEPAVAHADEPAVTQADEPAGATTSPLLSEPAAPAPTATGAAVVAQRAAADYPSPRQVPPVRRDPMVQPRNPEVQPRSPMVQRSVDTAGSPPAADQSISNPPDTDEPTTGEPGKSSIAEPGPTSAPLLGAASEMGPAPGMGPAAAAPSLAEPDHREPSDLVTASRLSEDSGPVDRPVAQASPDEDPLPDHPLPAARASAPADPPSVSSSTPVPAVQRQLAVVPEHQPRAATMPPMPTRDLPVVARTAAEPAGIVTPRSAAPGPEPIPARYQPPEGHDAPPVTLQRSPARHEPSPTAHWPTLGAIEPTLAAPEPTPTAHGPTLGAIEPTVTAAEPTLTAPEPTLGSFLQSESAVGSAPLSGFAARIAGMTTAEPEAARPDGAPDSTPDSATTPPVQRLPVAETPIDPAPLLPPHEPQIHPVLPVVARRDLIDPPAPAPRTVALVADRPPLTVRADLSSAVAPPPAVQRVSYAAAAASPVQSLPTIAREPAPDAAAEPLTGPGQPVSPTEFVLPVTPPTRFLDTIPVQRHSTMPVPNPAALPGPAAVAGPSRSFAAMFAGSPAGGVSTDGHPGYTTIQLQTADAEPTAAAPPEPSAPPAAEPPVETAPPPAVAPPAASAGGAGAPTPGAANANLDEMARRLFEPLSARLRAELWLDRERAGLVTDARH